LFLFLAEVEDRKKEGRRRRLEYT